MLPVIEAAWNQWNQGMSPYASVHLPGVGLDRMPYLPGIFFSHWPTWVLGLDLRWSQVVYRAIWTGLLCYKMRNRDSHSWQKDLFLLFVVNPHFNFRHDLYFEVFLLGLVLYGLYPKVRVTLIPVLVATRQWFWILGPFTLLENLKCRRAKPVRVVSLFFLSTLLVAGLTTWFLQSTTDAKTFLEAIFGFQSWVSRADYREDYGLTLIPFFFRLGWVRYSQWIQAALCVGLFFWAWRKKSVAEVRKIGSLCLIFFIFLNPHFWNYFWTSVALWILVTDQPEAA
jgi:hypothetical protein